MVLTQQKAPAKPGENHESGQKIGTGTAPVNPISG
jgi:hypothetical protein